MCERFGMSSIAMSNQSTNFGAKMVYCNRKFKAEIKYSGCSGRRLMYLVQVWTRFWQSRTSGHWTVSGSQPKYYKSQCVKQALFSKQLNTFLKKRVKSSKLFCITKRQGVILHHKIYDSQHWIRGLLILFFPTFFIEVQHQNVYYEPFAIYPEKNLFKPRWNDFSRLSLHDSHLIQSKWEFVQTVSSNGSFLTHN